MIVMDSKSQLTVDTIAKVAEGKIDIVNAAKLLNKSRRTIERYLQRYRDIGIQFIILKTREALRTKKPVTKQNVKFKRSLKISTLISI